MTTATAENEKKEEVKGGELLFCGVTEWDDVGRRKGSSELNLVSPTRLRPLVGVDIRYVAAGCAAAAKKEDSGAASAKRGRGRPKKA
ncbi:hypothetical protein Hanom_Chr07g00602401 [Helianthus anomalus]